VLRWCENITINHCNSSFTDDAFRIISSNWCNLSNSVANNNSNNGVWTTESTNNHINRNEMIFNSWGLILDDCADNNISDNKIDNNFDLGIGIWGGSNNTVINNTLSNNQEYGILLDEGNIHNITRNSMFECGVYIEGNKMIESMINNSIDDTNKVNGKPVYYYVHKKGLSINNFTNAGQVILINCSYAIISNLNLTHSTVGLALYHSDNNTISRINASFNSYVGLILGYSSGNNITESIFQENGDTGLLILDTDISEDNMIYTNAFIENGITTGRGGGGTTTNNAAGGSILNKWDNGTIGNYWSDYEGVDRNDNSIGDTSYLVTTYGDFDTPVYDNFPIWDDGPEVRSSSSSSSDGDKEVPPLAIPLGNYYLAFIIIPTLVLVFYYKKRKL
jgi:parallel beta-helix repeat protein